MTLLILIVLMLAQANGLRVPSWCWFIFAVQVFAFIITLIAKAEKEHG